LKHIGEKPYVLTVYDMIHEIYPEFFSVRDLTIQRKKQLIENATSVIAISHNTKNDIIRFTNVDPDRVSVVHLGNPLKPTDSLRHNEKKEGSLDLDVDYLLFVGKKSGYKNFNRMISSIASLLRDNTSLHLYFAGGGSFTPVEIELLKDFDVYSKVHFINISTDDLLIELYKNARAFIFPSLYEGFGLPILEAFSCGCPLVTSNSSSLSEIAGDAACFFDPESGDSIAEAVESILSNPDYRTDLIKKGYRRLKCFSWEKTARETKCVYDNTLYQYV
jgi:glycosyltransferase involved in cell wall biosynthesis